MIYSFSAQPGEVSSQLSYKVSYKMVETVDYVFDGGHEDWQISQWADKINFITRKLAHMTEYFALAIAVAFPLYVYGLHGFLLMLVAGVICVGFACGDEYHQSFVSGRSPAVKDVLIDSFGVFWGIVLVRIVGWTGRKTIFRPRKHKSKNDNYSQGNGGYPPGMEPYNGAYPPGGGYNGTCAPGGGYNGTYAPGDGYNGTYAPGGGYNGTYAPGGGYNGTYAPGSSYNNNTAPGNGAYPPNYGYYAPPPTHMSPEGYEEDSENPPSSLKDSKPKKEKDWLFDDFV